MILFYAGIGFAMLTTVVAVFETSTTINKKQFEFISNLPNYFLNFIKINNLKINKDLKNYLNIF